MRIRHAAPAISLLCLAIAGCTTVSPGDPASVPTSEVSTTSPTPPSSGSEDDLPSHGAPKVEDPLDTTRYQQDPCSALSASQAQELNLPTSGVQKEVVLGIGCEWYNSNTRGRVQIGFFTRNDRGLSAVYDADQRGEYAYFLPLSPIEGYPAIASDIEDRRPTGICIIDVGVTDQLLVDVTLYLSQANVEKVEPCEMAEKVAGMALRTMIEGA
jgi:hypothetical protein